MDFQFVPVNLSLIIFFFCLFLFSLFLVYVIHPLAADLKLPKVHVVVTFLFIIRVYKGILGMYVSYV